MFLGCPSARRARSFVRQSGQILLPRYLTNGLSNLDETCRDYSLALTDGLIRVWGSNVRGQGHSMPMRSNLMNTICHELLEQSRVNLRVKTVSPY